MTNLIQHVMLGILTVALCALSLYSAKLYKLAYKDQLTGLWNSRYFFKKGCQILKKISKKDNIWGVLFVDLDFFKSINDNGSHATGDLALQLVAQTIAAAFEKDSLVARRSGDEFIILSRYSSEQEIKAMELSLRTKIMELSVKNNQGGRTNLSATVGFQKIFDGISLEQSVDIADKKMLEKKKRRKIDR